MLEPSGRRRVVLSAMLLDEQTTTRATLTTEHGGRLVPFDPAGADNEIAATIAAAPRLLHYAALAAAYRAAEREFDAVSFSIGYADPFDAASMSALRSRRIAARRARDVLGRELDQLTGEILKLHQRTGQ